jgi:hypothetical protein
MVAISDAVRSLETDLKTLFGPRLRSLIAYAGEGGVSRTPTLAVVDGLSADDLRACAARVAAWRDAGLDTPLLLARQEFARSLDAFPFEFGSILADHVLVCGVDPFDGLRVDAADLRRACEVQARGHLLHLREAYIETGGRGDAIADLIRRSVPALAALVRSIARLEGLDWEDPVAAGGALERALGVAPGDLARILRLDASASLSADEARRIFPAYLETVGQLTSHVDRWTIPR